MHRNVAMSISRVKLPCCCLGALYSPCHLSECTVGFLFPPGTAPKGTATFHLWQATHLQDRKVVWLYFTLHDAQVNTRKTHYMEHRVGENPSFTLLHMCTQLTLF